MTTIYYPNFGVLATHGEDVNTKLHLFTPLSVCVDDTTIAEASEAFEKVAGCSDEIYRDIHPKKDITKEKRRFLTLEKIMEACRFYEIKVRELI